MRSIARRQLIGFFLAMTCALAMTSCIPPDDGSPQITSMTITPSTIKKSSIGMTDESFTITIETANFTEPLESADVRIQDLNRSASTDTAPEISGDTIVIKNVLLSWFNGAAPGTYAISAKVFSEGDLQAASEINLATVTVEE